MVSAKPRYRNSLKVADLILVGQEIKKKNVPYFKYNGVHICQIIILNYKVIFNQV